MLSYLGFALLIMSLLFQRPHILQSASMITQCWWLKHARIPTLILPFFIVTHHPTVTVQTPIRFFGKPHCINTASEKSNQFVCIYSVSTLCPLIFYWTVMWIISQCFNVKQSARALQKVAILRTWLQGYDKVHRLPLSAADLSCFLCGSIKGLMAW